MHLRTREPRKLSLLTCTFGGAMPHVYSSEDDMDLPAPRDKGRDQHTMHARDKMQE